ncbi:MAG: hypothetical protein ABI705_13130 [Aestuariivirga sp.]
MYWQHSSTGYRLIGIITLWLLFGMACVKLITLSYAFELPEKERNTYLRLALGNSNGAVRKFSKAGPLAVIGTCTSIRRDKCRKILNEKLSDSWLGISRIELKITSQNPDLIFLFTDTSGALQLRPQLSKTYDGGFIDSDDVECQLYYSIKHNVIEKVHIVVSLDSPELKQNLCLAVQLPHGLGLALTSDLPFSKIWKQPPVEMLEGESVFTEHNVSIIKHGYGVFSYIHMCPDIKPGMKADELTQRLSGNSICADGLKLLP